MRETARTFKYIIRKEKLNAQEAGRLKVFLLLRGIKGQFKKQPPLLRPLQELYVMIQNRTDYTFEDKKQTALYNAIFNLIVKGKDFINIRKEAFLRTLNSLIITLKELQEPYQLIYEKADILNKLEQMGRELYPYIHKELKPVLNKEQFKALDKALTAFWQKTFIDFASGLGEDRILKLERVSISSIALESRIDEIKTQIYLANMLHTLIEETGKKYGFDFSCVFKRDFRLLEDNGTTEQMLKDFNKELTILLEKIEASKEKHAERQKQIILKLFGKAKDKSLNDLKKETQTPEPYRQEIINEISQDDVNCINYLNDFENRLIRLSVKDFSQTGDQKQ